MKVKGYIDKSYSEIAETFRENFTLHGEVLIEKRTDSSSEIAISNVFDFPYDIQNMPSNRKEKAIIEITYKNVYGDKWRIRSNMTSPGRLD